MNTLIYISLAVNILVLAPILVLMAIKSPVVDHAWGGFTEARGILMSIYFAILAVSLFLVFKPVPSFVFALLLVQVIYKITTPFTVRSFSNPVVISNLFIAALHIFTLFSLSTAIQEQLAI
ncbi:MAG: hypothetical protein RLZZ380_1073 [Actinomycetota bacterium]|jgi:hypothetical protein